ncbi:biotin--[acetyl-CoA-carboxylase] ligase [Thermococcus sp. Bubb.Bath]|uniref:biotin--[acetyl-CoA-carboxylase] ligase n=1 Tax=Thermococcus sp. Bubb.Bath TaxID=1638242 RepID=UPI00143AA127|nr:biotin--[acetyl-CoA-carboxylase] ligase [Thermococcus sp. Bubb.Bath]NJF24135.1 biotin--[acetyl-CoA-carboxylase] ligase [Thermococcus sp. Bubb.Bath]
MNDVKVIGKKIIRLEEVDSTNRYAKDIAPEAPEGTVVVARRQSSGRGRLGRRWESPEGGLWLSVILKPEKPDLRLVFIGGLAVVDTLLDFGLQGGIKWPNDVWVNGKKISGVLTEGKGNDYVLLGIGLNVNNPLPPELSGSATSMMLEIGRAVTLERVLDKLLFHLDVWYTIYRERPDLLMARLRERTFILGRTVRVTEGETTMIGRALDVLDDGSLLLEVGGELKRILYGDVSLRPV